MWKLFEKTQGTVSPPAETHPLPLVMVKAAVEAEVECKQYLELCIEIVACCRDILSGKTKHLFMCVRCVIVYHDTKACVYWHCGELIVG